jgi:RNA polymerase sigma-70 factor, ECF subfamily
MDQQHADRTETFVGLFAQSQYEIHGFILTLVPNWADADDLMQKTSIVLWRKFAQFQPGTNFVAWACQIARLEVNNFRRVQGRCRLLFDDALLDSLGSVRLSMREELETERALLSDCMTRLKTADRELVRYCYGQKCRTAKEAAAELGRPVNTIYKALVRIRRELFDCIQRTLRARDHS